MNKQQIQAYIRDQEQIITGVGDYLWKNPETAFSEFKAVEKICGVLEEAGFIIEKGVGSVPTAFTATYGSGKFWQSTTRWQA